ncbi:bifunctional glutamate N-acetyltransferase/amino-acid acetyltransferase ArgJ [Elusimicrobiota bacterium]
MLPKGFLVGGVKCAISKNKKREDLGLFVSDAPSVTAGLFTKNIVKAAPVVVSAKYLKTNGNSIRAIVANSGCANACTGKKGKKDAEAMCEYAAKNLNTDKKNVLIASTGVIGTFLPLNKINSGIKKLAKKIGKTANNELSAARSIMTTDTHSKIVSKKLRINSKQVTIWGCAKGSGMIHPNLAKMHATMLSFILTDISITKKCLENSLSTAVESSFNCISVDSDTSTNDTVFIMANGLAGNRAIVADKKECKIFSKALNEVTLELAKMLVKDGEGATKFVEVNVKNALNEKDAKKIASTVATSPLFKTAVFGHDPNWGRIIAAAGRAGVCFNPDLVDVYINNKIVVKKGIGVNFSEKLMKKELNKKEIKFKLDLKQGSKTSKYYTCDFSYDYVKINASYRS